MLKRNNLSPEKWMIMSDVESSIEAGTSTLFYLINLKLVWVTRMPHKTVQVSILSNVQSLFQPSL